jgi:pyruvate/2-oxoglutarate dehydrogenase complex dihydrolipoamide acyltransferase (E2) component
MGTVAVTATGMAAPGVLAWGIPQGIHPLAIGVGGIAQRGTPDGIAEVLALTVVFDHDVTDGAPVGRFVNRLNELMTQANGLDDMPGPDPILPS